MTGNLLSPLLDTIVATIHVYFGVNNNQNRHSQHIKDQYLMLCHTKSERKTLLYFAHLIFPEYILRCKAIFREQNTPVINKAHSVIQAIVQLRFNIYPALSNHWGRYKMTAIQIDSLIFLHGNSFIFITISMKCVPNGPNYNKPDMMQIMAYRRAGDKPLPEPSKAGFFYA